MNKLFIVFLFFTTSFLAQQPQRKALIGIIGKEVKEGIQADSVIANSTMAAAGLQKEDVLVEINNAQLFKLSQFNSIAGKIRNGDNVIVKYYRQGVMKKQTVTAVMKPLETLAFADVQYDWVKFRNGYLRAITRKPKGKVNVPCILLIPGYGCGSVENYMNSYNGRLITEWVKAGYAVATIEKSGMGDSEGCEPCTEVDLQTDIESFDAGYRYMEQLPFIDKTKLFIWGHSMGGTIAPEVARRHSPKGVMVFACVYRPWSEFLLEMHRVQKPLLENLDLQQTENFVRQIQKIYYEFFVLKKTPAQLHDIPEYKALVESELNYKDGSNEMWGRHWRFWQQLDSINLAETWNEVKCPVLVLHGGADYEQCSMVEPLMIKETVNAAHPATATWVTISDLDHFMMKSSDWKEAAKNFKEQQYLKGNFNYRIAEETVKWLGK